MPFGERPHGTTIVQRSEHENVFQKCDGRTRTSSAGPVYGNGFSRVDLSRESARHRELSGSQRQFIGFDFLLYAARELIENGKKILFG